MKAPFNEDNTMGQMIISILKENGWTYIPAEKSQGVKQLVAGGGVALIGITLVPLLSGLLG